MEQCLAFATNRMELVSVKKDMVVPDATSASVDITGIQIADHAIAARLDHPLLAVMPRENVLVSPTLLEGLVISAVLAITCIQSV